MADVFISYSRKDEEFVQHLYTAFINAKRTPWIDWQSIPRGEDWWREIQFGIEGADTFLCVISENWLVSEICHKELLYARQNNKRVLPLIRQQVKDDVEQRIYDTWIAATYEQMARDNWNYICHLNWIFFNDDVKFDGEFAALLKTLDEDQPHIKAHTRYQLDALDWERGARNPSFLMIGDNLTFAENWLNESTDKSPQPTELQREYITASRHAEDAQKARDTQRERRIVQFRSASLLLGIVGVVAVLATGIAISQTITSQNDAMTATVAQGLAIDQAMTATVAQGLSQINEGTAIANAEDANAQVIIAGVTLTVIPQTLTPARVTQQAGETFIARSDEQLATATSQLGIAQQEVAVAEIQAAQAETNAAQAQGTATQIPPTLTQAAVTVIAAQVEQEIANESAQAILSLLQRDPTTAIALMNDIVERYPDNSLAYLSRGLIYSSMGNYPLAIEDYTTAIVLDPQYATAYYNRGFAQAELSHYEAAIEDYTAAIAIDPQYINAYNNRGLAYAGLGEYEAAIEDYITALAINPQFPNAYTNRGAAYQALGEYEAAIEDYTTAIAIDPQYVEAYSNRGVVYATIGDYEAAINDYTAALAINPQQAEVYINRGAAYRALGDYEAAINDYTAALAINPQQAEAYSNRGNVYADLGDYDAAIEDYDTAIALNSQDADIYYNRGIAYYFLDEYPLAIADFSIAIELNPDHADAFYNRGLIYAILEDYGSAIDDFSYAIVLNPQDASAYYNRGLSYFLRAHTLASVDRRSDLKHVLEDWQQVEELGYELPSDIQDAMEEIEDELGIDE